MDKDLNALSNGEIALLLFSLNNEYTDAQKQRADAASEMICAEAVYNDKQERFNDALQEEKELAARVRKLESYLKSRLAEE